MKLNREQCGKERTIIRKRRRDVVGVGVLAECPYVAGRCFGEVVPRPKILVLDDLIGIVKYKFAAKRIGVSDQSKQSDQQDSPRAATAIKRSGCWVIKGQLLAATLSLR